MDILYFNIESKSHSPFLGRVALGRLIRYSQLITQPKRPFTKINRMCSDKSLVGDPAGI